MLDVDPAYAPVTLEPSKLSDSELTCPDHDLLDARSKRHTAFEVGEQLLVSAGLRRRARQTLGAQRAHLVEQPGVDHVVHPLLDARRQDFTIPPQPDLDDGRR